MKKNMFLILSLLLVTAISLGVVCAANETATQPTATPAPIATPDVTATPDATPVVTPAPTAAQ